MDFTQEGTAMTASPAEPTEMFMMDISPPVTPVPTTFESATFANQVQPKINGSFRLFTDGLYNMIQNAEATVIIKVLSRNILEKHNPIDLRFRTLKYLFSEEEVAMVHQDASYKWLYAFKQRPVLQAFFQTCNYNGGPTCQDEMDRLNDAISIATDIDPGMLKIAQDVYAEMKNTPFFWQLVLDLLKLAYTYYPGDKFYY